MESEQDDGKHRRRKQLTKEQEELLSTIRKHILSGNGIMRLSACAGTGKTALANEIAGDAFLQQLREEGWPREKLRVLYTKALLPGVMRRAWPQASAITGPADLPLHDMDLLAAHNLDCLDLYARRKKYLSLVRIRKVLSHRLTGQRRNWRVVDPRAAAAVRDTLHQHVYRDRQGVRTRDVVLPGGGAGGGRRGL